jgi:phosphoglycolate phosphatase
MASDLAVFDLDGTLVETGPDLVDSCNHVLAARGMPQVPPETLHPFIGLGALRMISGALDASGISVTEEELDGIYADYLVHYESRISRYSRPFPEMATALDVLADEDVAVAVCTNKKEALARKLLTEIGVIERLAGLSGGDTYGVSKPDPEHLLRTIADAGGTPERTVFVGDSRIDRETARAAGVPMVGVTYGYTDVPMRELSPERCLAQGEDVAAAILHLLAAR